MKASRILLLAVALGAGGLAAFLATRGDAPAIIRETSVQVQVREEQKARILIASKPIGVGERLTTQSVEWADWPEGALRPEYVTIAAHPDAQNDISGAVARFEFFPGEPIREQKLVRSEQGYLSAVLEEGKRGVSIPISAETGAGGFIIPNDHVDVILTKETDNGYLSETIVTDVKVLAIGNRLGEVGASAGNPDPANPQAQMFEAETIATLELDPYQAETVADAVQAGDLSLALRSIVDFNKGSSGSHSGREAVSVIRFGKQANVMMGAAPVASNAVSDADEGRSCPEISTEEPASEPAVPMQ
jgi:pilus assembly protein CpaB